MCGRTETAKSRGPNPKRLSKDHDHHTGDDRGFLCHRCNLLLGFADDDVELLNKAIAYLLFWRR